VGDAAVRALANRDPDVKAAAAAALATLLTLLGLAAPTLRDGAWIGNGTADLWGHAWGYAWTARSVATGAWPWLAPLDGGQPWWLVDPPLAIAAAPVAAAFGPRVAWNTVQLVLPALVAASYADALRRWRGGDPVGQAAFGWALAVSPFARGLFASGVPEGFAVLGLPWLTAAAGGGVAAGVVAVVAAAIALSGPYAAVAGLAIGVALVVARVPLQRGHVAAAVGGASGAALQVGGLLATAHPALGGGGGGALNPGSTWAWAARGGADLANFVAPRLLLPPPEASTLHRHVVYLGVIALAAAILGARRDPAARGLLVLGAVAAVLSLGDRLGILGLDTGLPLPAALLPGLGANAYRLAGLTVAAVLAAAWRGADRRAALVAVGITLEGLWAAPVERLLPGAADPISASDGFLAANPGAVVDLPVDREGRLPKGPCPQRALVHQAAHGQPIASALYRAPRVLSVAPIRAIDEAIARAGRADRVWARPRNPVPTGATVAGAPFSATAAERAALKADGYRWLTLDAVCVPPAVRGAVVRTLEGWLGPPVLRDGEGGVWAL
jgi:hypothetical protein